MKALYDLITRGLSAIGMSAALVFLFGYTYASVPLPKTCTPTVMDRILK